MKEAAILKMNLSKKQQEFGLLLLSIVLFISVGTYSYLKLYAPVKETHEQLKIENSNQRDILYALRMQEAGKTDTDFANSHTLQRKVPVLPLEDAVLLQITKAEVKSGSTVLDVDFSLGEFVIPDATEGVTNVNQLLTEVYIESDSYSSIEKFIVEIEQMDRIFIVEAIEMESPEEKQDIDGEIEPMRLTLSFSAFYRPDLVELKGDTPKVDAPSSAEKNDPTPFNDSAVEGEVE